jgi:predicted nuclease of predicted toxin-antitoxin system
LLSVSAPQASTSSIFYIREIGSGTPDEHVLAIANTENCVLITKDDDFGELVIRQQRKVRGLILLQLDRLSRKARDDGTVEIISDNVNGCSGNLMVVKPDHIRVRPLPVTENQ